jgi:hypothetical protein
MELTYFQTFVQVATDCPVKAGKVPTPKNGKKSIAVLEYELISAHPYGYTQDEVQFQVHLRHKNVPAAEIQSRREQLRAEFLAKPHACLRASPLAKTYGWGFHFDEQGRVAIYPVESSEYAELAKRADLAQVFAMRSKRARGKADPIASR